MGRTNVHWSRFVLFVACLTRVSARGTAAAGGGIEKGTTCAFVYGSSGARHFAKIGVRRKSLAVRMSLRESIAISGGTGNNWANVLGVRMADELKKKGAKAPLFMEPRLRMAAEAPTECNVDGIYRDTALEWDAGMFGLHSSSGMRISSGCPARLLYGVQAGCQACKCVVPSIAEMKRFCPYYGGADHAAPRSAWDISAGALRKKIQVCSVMVMLSVSEDIDLALDSITMKRLILYQVKLAKFAYENNVPEILLVGPSDSIQGGVHDYTQRLKRQAKMSLDLDSRVSQIKGVEADLKDLKKVSQQRLDPHKDSLLRPLAAEKGIRALGVPLKTLRAPSQALISGDVAEMLVSLLMSPNTESQILLQ